LPTDRGSDDERGRRHPPVQRADRTRPGDSLRARRGPRFGRVRGQEGARRPVPRRGRAGAGDPRQSRRPYHRAPARRLHEALSAFPEAPMPAKQLVLDLAIRYGFQVVGAFVVLGVGVLVAWWMGTLVERSLGRWTIEPPMRRLIIRAVRVVVLL